MLQLNNATGEACKHTKDKGYISSRAASRDTESGRDTGSAPTSVAYGNVSCSKEKQLLVKMLILLDAAFESTRWAVGNNTLDNFSQPFGFLCVHVEIPTESYLLSPSECVLPPSLCRLKCIMTGR